MFIFPASSPTMVPISFGFDSKHSGLAIETLCQVTNSVLDFPYTTLQSHVHFCRILLSAFIH